MLLLRSAGRGFNLPASAGLRLLSDSATVGAVNLAVFAWGSAAQGALGGGGSGGDQFEPAAVLDLPPDIVSIGCGHFHSFAITAQGQLFTWGRNKEWQLGRPLDSNEFDFSAKPRLLRGAFERHAAASATGSGVASFVVTTDGLLYAFGTSKRGQLGLGEAFLTSREPRRVKVPGRVVQVAAGWGHAAAVTDDGSLYTWGWPASGRLGHSFARGAADEAEQALTQRCVWLPQRVTLLDGVRVGRVACGFDTTLVQTQDGSLLSFGDDSLGQLGRPSRQEGEHAAPADVSTCLVHPPADEEPRGRHGAHTFRHVAAGLGHAVSVMGDGSVLAWGWNVAGQLGLGEQVRNDILPSPHSIYGLPRQRLARVAAGRVHTLLLTDDIRHERASSPVAYGRSWPCLTSLHSWGSASNGRLGTGSYSDCAFPEILAELDGYATLDVACGLDHSLALAMV